MRDTTIQFLLEIEKKTCGECNYACSQNTRRSCIEAFIKYASMKSTYTEFQQSANSDFHDISYTNAKKEQTAEYLN